MPVISPIRQSEVGIDDDVKTYLTSAVDAAALLPQRSPDSHKGDYGKLFVKE